jgi:archaetidylinositol phosphate synthase
MENINPNAISWAGLVVAALAGFGFYLGGPTPLFVAILLLLLSAYLDALDGRVAKMFQKTSVRGDFLDHVFDRYADVFLLAGLSFGIYCGLSIGIFALIGVLLTSYMGTQAQALGQGRRYAGFLGRADRLVLLFLGGLLQLLTAPSGGIYWGLGVLRFQPLEWVMVLFGVLGNATAIQRAVAIWRGIPP